MKRLLKPIALTPAEIAELSELDMRAYYKRTAPIADAVFFAVHVRGCSDRRLVLSAGTLAIQASNGALDRVTIYLQLGRLQARWRALDYTDGLSVVHNKLGAELRAVQDAENDRRQAEADALAQSNLDNRELRAQGF